MLNRVRLVGQLGRHFGPGWMAYRIGYAARLRSGMLRRKTRPTSWGSLPLRDLLQDPSLADPARYLAYRRQQAPPFFFSTSNYADYQPVFAQWDTEDSNPVKTSNDLAEGKFRYFEHITVPLGFPPDWHTNPFTGQRVETDRHWTQIGDFGHGDIKAIWEPSRFGFAYDLARAYWRTGDDRYPETFWRLVESWREQNPPQLGPNWKCGQETSFRVMACCFGLYAFANAPSTTAERVVELAQLIAISGKRILANFDYALSQRNNHGISEAVGLWTIGLLFPELRSAAQWLEIGRGALESQAQELIYEDGSFAQHSVNYHRLMLHDYLWGMRLGDLHKQPLSHALKDRVSRATELLYQIQDEESGRVPYYGQNDGALILPLDNCDYLDFRPVIQALHFYLKGERCYESGPWDEDLLWLFGREALRSTVTPWKRHDLRASDGGYYTLRSSTGFAFTRCATFRHRPGQADMLHADLWWRGQNIAVDAGTYSYNAAPPWNNPLAHTRYHNTVSVDDLDQMERVGKFLWLPWMRGRVRCMERRSGGLLAYWEGEHNGYTRLNPPATHRRGILQLGNDAWLVLDLAAGKADRLYRLHWLFPDLPYEWATEDEQSQLALHTPVGPYHVRTGLMQGGGTQSIMRAEEEGVRGWRAPYYYYREPAISLDSTVRGQRALFWTLFSPDPAKVTLTQGAIEIQSGPWRSSVEMVITASRPMLRTASFSGAGESTLKI